MADQAAEYKIRALADATEFGIECWVAVQHIPCAEFVFGTEPSDGNDLTADKLAVVIQNHVCDPANLAYEENHRAGVGP